MDGIIVINKPKNCTSHDVVYKVKKIFNEKVGHTGTLDPLATGVLPLLIGKGTLCSKYLINHDKTYEVELTLGKKTDTADSEGKIIETNDVPKEILKQQNVEKVLNSFIGKQKQIPPIYSAIKVKGKKLYEYARKGQEVEIQPREIEIYSINLMKINSETKKIEFQVHCSKGTYIRTLCEDIAEKLSTVGYMSELNRIQVGTFTLSEAVSIENLEKAPKEKYLITIERIFEKCSSIELKDVSLKKFLNGVKITKNEPDGVYRIYNKGTFVGTGILKDGKLKRDIIL